MKLWLVHKVSGEDYGELEEEMKKVCGKLEELGIEGHCSFLENETRNQIGKEELIKNAFQKINEYDGVLAIIKSEDLSEGMLIEIGYAVAKEKNFILFIKKGIMEGRYVRVFANRIIEFDDSEDLLNKLEEVR